MATPYRPWADLAPVQQRLITMQLPEGDAMPFWWRFDRGVAEWSADPPPEPEPSNSADPELRSDWPEPSGATGGGFV
jgi:hypothetical protein